MHYLITDLPSHHVFLQAQLNAIRSFLYLHHALPWSGQFERKHSGFNSVGTEEAVRNNES